VDPDAVLSGKQGRSRDGCIRWGGYRRRGMAVLGMNLGRPIVNQWDFVAQLCENGSKQINTRSSRLQ